MQMLMYGVIALGLLILVLTLIAPTRISYTEAVSIRAPASQVYDDIRLQEHLMRWSAWPKETKSTCSVEGSDGQVGARTVFFSKGKRVGHQEIVGLKEDREVALTLIGPGPPHRPRLTFELERAGANETRVLAHFTNELPRPFNIIWKFAGLSAWTRRLHRKDLDGLKAFAEPPHTDATGQVVGRPPVGKNPFEHRAPTA